MFGDASKPSLSYYEKKRIDIFMDKLRQMSKITIYVTEQLDGYTCALDPWSRIGLKVQDSETLPASVFVSYDTRGQFEFFNGPIWKHIIEILTGSSAANLQMSGGVVFVDPRTMQILFKSPAQHV